jgi:Fe-S cluster biogenesis protein NfuA
MSEPDSRGVVASLDEFRKPTCQAEKGAAVDAANSHPGAALKARVEHVLDIIRPYLATDGGDIELVRVDGERVEVRFHGACVGCPSSQQTLQFGVERTIKEYVPEITSVVAV